MKQLNLIHLYFILFLLFGCRSGNDYNKQLSDIRADLGSGKLNDAISLADSLKKVCPDNIPVYRKADSLAAIAVRTALDFRVTEEEVMKQVEKRNGPFSKEDKAKWEDKGWLEWKLLNGNKMYFNRAASNLILLRKFYEDKEKSVVEKGNDPSMILRLKHTEEVYRISGNRTIPVVPVNMQMTYTITVHPDVVPEGAVIRCWLPWPRSDRQRQKNIKLISTSDPKYIISPDSSTHSTIYMESASRKGIPSVFSISYSYESNGQYFNLAKQPFAPYDKNSADYKKYTSEQLPHICFTENIKQLTDSITGNDSNPVSIVNKIYSWFKENIPWTGALEYSIIPNIPEYVYKNRRGDCGMQTFLFMSMLRYKGIPVRWQSGWMVPPDSENLHDWCEVYYEGTGWVPADVSYDLQQSNVKAIKEFYISGIDSYRLIVNDGIAGPLYPEKLFLRSEPYDFQRGEVEWKGGNLYFDKWDYDMKIRYLE